MDDRKGENIHGSSQDHFTKTFGKGGGGKNHREKVLGGQKLPATNLSFFLTDNHKKGRPHYY